MTELEDWKARALKAEGEVLRLAGEVERPHDLSTLKRGDHLWVKVKVSSVYRSDEIGRTLMTYTVRNDGGRTSTLWVGDGNVLAAEAEISRLSASRGEQDADTETDGVAGRLAERAKNLRGSLQRSAEADDGDWCAAMPPEIMALMDADAALDEQAADLIAKLLARGEVDGWRPIETAPKDGTKIVFLNKFGHCSDVVHWRPAYEKHGLTFPGRFKNRGGQATGMADDIAWEFWALAPAILSLPPLDEGKG